MRNSQLLQQIRIVAPAKHIRDCHCQPHVLRAGTLCICQLPNLQRVLTPTEYSGNGRTFSHTPRKQRTSGGARRTVRRTYAASPTDKAQGRKDKAR